MIDTLAASSCRPVAFVFSIETRFHFHRLPYCSMKPLPTHPHPPPHPTLLFGACGDVPRNESGETFNGSRALVFCFLFFFVVFSCTSHRLPSSSFFFFYVCTAPFFKRVAGGLGWAELKRWWVVGWVGGWVGGVLVSWKYCQGTR